MYLIEKKEERRSIYYSLKNSVQLMSPNVV